MLTEFGGIALRARTAKRPGATRAARPPTSFRRALSPNCSTSSASLPLLAGFCYTQFADTYQEANGLLYADRTPKFPIHEIALATRGGAVHQGGFEQLLPTEEP